MIKHGFTFIIITLIILGCRTDAIDYSQQILGDWAHIDDHGYYAELYIEFEDIKSFHEKDGDFFGRMKYSIEKDSIFFNQMRYQIAFQDDKSIILRNNDFTLHLYRIYPIKLDSINSINPFYLRRCNFLVNKGIISMKKAIDYLNKLGSNIDEWQPEEELLL